MVELANISTMASMNLGSIGIALLVFFGSLLFMGMIGFLVYYTIQKKQLKYSIPLLKMVGGKVEKVTTFKAKDFKIGSAGDKLWYVPKAKKYISVGTLQTGKNEYTHFEREDGEWINISYPDIDLMMKTMGVRYIQTDMRSNRIAISNILDQRFAQKESFWKKYGSMITQLIFYMVVCICMVVIFWMWSGIVESTSLLVDKIALLQDEKCPSSTGVVPALVFFMLKPFKQRKKQKWLHL
jgi:hypothetical protein